jgi:hypothetical protein
MTTRFILPLLLSLANLGSASMLFLDAPPRSSVRHVMTHPPIDIQWGNSPF